MKTMIRSMKSCSIRSCVKGVAGFLAMLLVAPVWAASTLEAIEFSSLPGDRTEIRLTFDGVPPEPTGYTIEQPARIVLDLPGVVSVLEEKRASGINHLHTGSHTCHRKFDSVGQL